MAEPAMSREFALVAACCRWPLTGPAIASIKIVAATPIDWPVLLQVAVRQRVVGLVNRALLTAQITVPATVAASLAQRAARIADYNEMLASETVRLQQSFRDAGIPALALKGVALARLACGSAGLKHTRDIDLLVSPRDAGAALRLMEADGYALTYPRPPLSEVQRRAVVQYGKDVELKRGHMAAELQWRPAANRQLLKRIDAAAPGQGVVMPDGAPIHTLAEADLFAYLCVHGAGHFWSRLKWLADLNALVAAKNEPEIIALYRHAQSCGAGLCAGQALLLCHRLLDLPLPIELAREFERSGRLEHLVALALRAMTRADPALDRGIPGVIHGVFAQFLLGRGFAFFAEQCPMVAINVGDVVRVPLPPPLQFLYPLLRLPLWLWRRAGFVPNR